MNIEELISNVNNCKTAISEAKLEDAKEALKNIKDVLPSGDLLNQSILLLGNIAELDKEQIEGTSDDGTKRNKINSNILKYLDIIEEKYISELDVKNFENVDLKESVSLILEKVSKDRNLTLEESEEIYLHSLKLRQEIYSGIDSKISQDYPQILFSRIFFAHQLEQEELNQIHAIPSNKKYQWFEKSIIVSALGLSLIKEFNPDKVQLLINFVTQFEDNVWQRALTALSIGLHNKAHILKLYPELEVQLNNLKEIPQISKGLQTIAIELNNEHYNGCFRVWQEIIGSKSFKVLRNVDAWFIPYYKDNPIINQVKSRMPDIEDVHMLPDLILNDRHLSNSQKYALVLNLEHFPEVKIKRIINKLKRMSKCKREHIYDPYIADFYWFYKTFPKLELEDIFKGKIELYKSKFIEFLIPENKVDLFRGVIEFRNDNHKSAITLLKGQEINDAQIGLNLREQGYFNYLIFDYDESILKFETKLKEETDQQEIGLLHSNLSLLYIIKNDKIKTKEHIDGAIKGMEYRFSAKNLGYLHILNDNLSAAKTNFNVAIRNFGFDNFIFQVDNDFEHIAHVIDKSKLDSVLKEIRLKHQSNN